jgi:hypothetical protein
MILEAIATTLVTFALQSALETSPPQPKRLPDPPRPIAARIIAVEPSPRSLVVDPDVNARLLRAIEIAQGMYR